MKGGGGSRSHRPLEPDAFVSSSLVADEWTDGSWTVDCSCGVTFDDGEEMVSCDVCGVWVHTRCARFSRGEISFTCHNCKPSAPAAAPASDAGDSFAADETDIAQLLVDLPSKAVPPFRRWSAVTPLHDRVHVQSSIDHSLFAPLPSSSIFTPALWRCSGYVPKKFSFQYRDIPFLEEGDDDNGPSVARKGADALFALSKDLPSAVAATAIEITKRQRSRVRAAEGRSKEHKDERASRSKSLLGAGTQKKSWDANVDIVKSDSRHDRSHQMEESVFPSSEICEDQKRANVAEANSLDQLDMGLVDEFSNEGMIQNTGRETLGRVESNDIPVQMKIDLPSEIKLQETKEGSTALTESFDANPLHDLELKNEHHMDKIPQGILSTDLTKLVCGKHQSLISTAVATESCSVTCLELGEPALKIEDNPPSTGEAVFSSANSDKVKKQDSLSLKPSSLSSSDILKNQEVIDFPSRETNSNNETAEANRESHDGADAPQKHKVETEDVVESSTICTSSSDIKPITSYFGKPKEAEALAQMHESEKSAFGVTKPSSDQNELVDSKSSHCDTTQNSVALDQQLTSGVVQTARQLQTKSSGSSDGRRAFSKTSIADEECAVESSALPVQRQANQNVEKSSQTCRTSYASTTHSKLTYKVENPKPTKEPKRASTYEAAYSQSRNKSAHTNSHHRSEKVHEKATHDVSNTSALSYTQRADSTSNMSDEQLALWLHQQLNSSPRVPRVPRLHQGASMQSSSSTTAHLLKRSPATGGRDNISKRSKEDSPRYGHRISSEVSEDTRRVGRARSSNELKNAPTGSFLPRDSQSRLSENRTQFRKNHGASSADGTSSSSPTEASGFHMPSTNKFHKVHEDDTSDYHNARSLSGLIEDIVSKNKNVTYEELCNAVRTHWNDLRNSNGERYAYPSHIHAVRDCLRNRSEWVHLIEQAPKSGFSKRRKPNEMGATVSETENGNSNYKNDVKQKRGLRREDIPKGKRKARQRRKLDRQDRRNKVVKSTSIDDAAAALSDSSTGGNNDLDSDDESLDHRSIGCSGGTVSASSTSSGPN